MLNSSFDGNFDNNQLSLYLGTNVYSTIKTNFAILDYMLVVLNGIDKVN